MDDKIDFVLTWVDGSDPEWRKERQLYQIGQRNIENEEARYRDWGILRYWFRGVEKYAPWVNNIFFVTWGHIPKWLNTKDEKIHIVNHKDFIPKEYLPTFSSNPIELNLHRIEGLEEQFVYFNDDMFLIEKVSPSDFFVNSLPCVEAVLNVHCPQKSRPIQYIQNNDIGVINEHFDMKTCIRNNRKGYFAIKYGVGYLLRNLIFSTFPRFPGFKQHHLPSPLLKSVCDEVWDSDETLAETCERKFRTAYDVNQWLFLEWAIAKKQFYPYAIHKLGSSFSFDTYKSPDLAIERLNDILNNSKYKIVCVNDYEREPEGFDFDQYKVEVIKLFESRFPNKSRFEM